MGRSRQFLNNRWRNRGHYDSNCDSKKDSVDEAEVKDTGSDIDSMEPVASNHPDYPVLDVPVTLAEVQLEEDIEARINLPSPAREIKNIRKNLSLGETRVIPSVTQKDTVKLFVRGVVHKNIQYIDDTNGFVRDYSVDVPFNTTETVKVYNDFNHDYSQKNTVDEVRYLNKWENGAKRGEFGSFSFETYNEPITTKLLFAAVNELDMAEDFDYHWQFNSMLVNMEVILVFKLKQKQQVNTQLGRDTSPHHGSNVYENIHNLTNKNPY